MVIRRATVRHESLPAQGVVVRRRPAQSKTLYYVDHGNRRPPRVTSPPVTTSRRVLVHRSPPPPLIKPAVRTRAVRVVHRRAVTPPPTIIKTIRASPIRQINSDTTVVGRRRRVRRAEVETIPSSSEIIYGDTATSSRSNHHFKETGREESQEIVERVPTPQAVPTVVKRSYTRLPPGVDVPPDGEYAMNGKDEANKSLKDPSIYYIRSPSRAKLEGSWILHFFLLSHFTFFSWKFCQGSFDYLYSSVERKTEEAQRKTTSSSE